MFRSNSISKLISLILILIGLGVIVGWVFDISHLKSVWPDAVSMKFNTAFCFLLSAISLWLINRNPQSLRMRTAVLSLQSIVLAIVMLTVVEYLFQVNLGVDELLIEDQSTNPAFAYPGRMSMASAIAFLLISLSLLERGAGLGYHRLSQALIIFCILLGLIALQGYVFGIRHLYHFFVFTSIAVHTAIGFILLGFGILLSNVHTGFMATVSNPNLGGWIARRSLTIALMIPLLLAWLRLEGQRANLYDIEIGIALFATSMMVIFALLIWISALYLNQMHEDLLKRTINDAHLAAIVASSNDGIVSKDIHGIVTSWNPGAENLFQYTKQEIVGQSIDLLIPQDRLFEEEDIRNHFLKGEKVDHFDTVRRRKDGTLVNVSITIAPIFDRNGNVVGASQIVQNITERKRAQEELEKSEARYREVVGSIHEVIWMMNMEGEILYISPAFEEMSGRSVESLMANSNEWSDLIYFKDRDRVMEVLASIPARGFDIEYRILRPDGALRWIHSRGSPLANEQGVPWRIAGVSEDITEKKMIEEQLLRKQRLENIGSLAGGIAHDLNNVLAPILMGAEVLRAGKQDEDEAFTLKIIYDSAKRGAELIRQILTFARGSEGERIPTRLNDIIEEVVKIVRDTFPRSVELRVDIEEDCLPIQADPTQIYQVLMNLCLNSRDAMPDGGLLEIHCKNTIVHQNSARADVDHKPGPYVVLSVVDSGHGMSPETMEKIFDPFFTTKGIGKGTGLGLSTTQGIVGSHGGFVTVRSELDKGSSFEIHFPALLTSIPTAESTKVDHSIVGNGELILVIDDESNLREITRSILLANNYQVITAKNGSEGVDLFSGNKERVNLVITDMMMPVMDGTAAIQAIREIDPNAKIIAVSGLETVMGEKNHDQGVHFIRKPYAATILLSAVSKLLKPS